MLDGCWKGVNVLLGGTRLENLCPDHLPGCVGRLWSTIRTKLGEKGKCLWTFSVHLTDWEPKCGSFQPESWPCKLRRKFCTTSIWSKKNIHVSLALLFFFILFYFKKIKNLSLSSLWPRWQKLSVNIVLVLRRRHWDFDKFKLFHQTTNSQKYRYGHRLSKHESKSQNWSTKFAQS